MKLLELFSGTHSIGKIATKKGYEVISLDRDLPANINEDIMTWNYKIYPPKYFDIITASPVCLWWSNLRTCWVGRRSKTIHPTDIITLDILDNDIKKYGIPMVDKVIEIIKYFKPKYWWIENPQTGKMKNYFNTMEYSNEFNNYYDVDYCKYSEWGYQKRTRFWTNIKNFKPKKCKKDCDNLIKRSNSLVHKNNLGGNNWIIIDGKSINCKNKELREKYKDLIKNAAGGENVRHTTKLDRYRIPSKLIEELLDLCLITKL